MLILTKLWNYRSVKNVKVQCSSCNVKRRTKKIRIEVRGLVRDQWHKAQDLSFYGYLVCLRVH